MKVQHTSSLSRDHRKRPDTVLLKVSTSFPFWVVLLALGIGACQSDADRARAAAATALERTAWLGSADGWGILGFPAAGGALAYRRALNLEVPTWAPPELSPVTAALAGRGAAWVQFADSGLGFYEYATAHFRTFEDVEPGTGLLIALEGRRVLVHAPDSSSLSIVGAGESWSYSLGGRLSRLVPAGRGAIVVAVVSEEAGTELQVLEPPGSEALGRQALPGLRDFVVTAWGRELYYVTAGEGDLAIHGLSLPTLEPSRQIELSEPAELVTATPSAHRIYAASDSRLHVYDRQSSRKIGVVELPGRATALRFGLTGANLLVQLDGDDLIAVLQVGVDTVLGVITAEWDEDLPQAVPGGRLVARSAGQLVLYELPALTELTRVAEAAPTQWLAVEWQPPRPREEAPQPPALARAEAREDVPAPVGGAEAADDERPVFDPDAGVPVGYYAVVLAARARAGVERLVIRLRSVGYPGVMDLHRDVMGVEWYRAMIGPFPSRSRAEAAARDLGARYGYKPWILTIERPEGGGAEPGDSLARSGDEPAPADLSEESIR